MQHILASPWEKPVIPSIVPDKRLGYKLNPVYPDHDAKGFRNAFVPDSIEIAILGDSQTYGTGVPSELAWPNNYKLLLKKQQTQLEEGYQPYKLTHDGHPNQYGHSAVAREVNYYLNEFKKITMAL